MQKITMHLSRQTGLPPGTPVFIGEQKTEQVKISIIDYDQEQMNAHIAESVEECFSYKDSPTITWINVDGIHDAVLVEQLGQHYDIHPLMIEDILNTRQRLKVDIFDNYLFIVLKMPWYEEVTEEIYIEQVSIILGRNFVLTFQEEPEGDAFEIIRTRLTSNKGNIRNSGADYLAYALMDAVVDGYFVILDYFGEEIEELDDAISRGPNPEILQIIHALKRELIFFRKTVTPLRNMMHELSYQESPLIQKSTSIYLRDLSDHVIQVIDSTETFRDMMSGLHDVYLSSVSNKMNEIMQFLTIVGTIFIPLTFIAGIYGMNFRVMPELTWRWGYFAVMGLMLGIGIGLLVYFKKKRWL
jgi:magnesium transporter